MYHYFSIQTGYALGRPPYCRRFPTLFRIGAKFLISMYRVRDEKQIL
jgi:hypothetical protein